ncbi:MAG: hypothetical protein E6F95_09180 [Actinobacteria bacterium]|nr:MAG: hypothetical protein E6F95_09180 [Actinomycetota bacterium]
MPLMLVAVVVVETIVLALLSVVVVALLRSHAEILRRLPEPEEPEPSLPHDEPIVLSDGARLPAHLPSPRRRATEAHDISGTTPAGDAVVVSMAVGSNTVLAFLSTGCLTCRTFWDGLQPAVRTPLPGGARVVVVVKDPAFESPSKLRELAPPDVQVVQSSRAWEDFGIEMSPYFCFVDGATGEVRSEGAAMTWGQVASLLRDALLDEELAART